MFPGSRRAAQIHASTIFALTLAILAGLIGAFLFKNYLMAAKPTAGPAAEAFEITVASANLTDRVLIQPNHVKKVKVSKQLSEEVVGNPKYLRDAQPVGRTTVKPVYAEEPITADMVEELSYPAPVSSKLKQGRRAVVVEVPGKSAMVQVGDHVDLLATLDNERFGSMSTAIMARNALVVARFNTTRTAALPVANDPNRTFTLEVTPYRHALIELAKQFGAHFTLSVSAKSMNEGAVVREMEMDQDPQTERVTAEDLAKIFGVPLTSGPDIIRIERFTGVTEKDILRFPGVDQGSPMKTTLPPVRPPISTPGTTAPRPATPSGSSSRLPRDAGSSFVSANSATDRNFGFRPISATGAGCAKPGG